MPGGDDVLQAVLAQAFKEESRYVVGVSSVQIDDFC